jgi:hypothetical protein
LKEKPKNASNFLQTAGCTDPFTRKILFLKCKTKVEQGFCLLLRTVSPGKNSRPGSMTNQPAFYCAASMWFRRNDSYETGKINQQVPGGAARALLLLQDVFVMLDFLVEIVGRCGAGNWTCEPVKEDESC